MVAQFDVADNMDLSLVFSEFEAYYEMRFDKKPKMIRKAAEDSSAKMPRPPRAGDSGGGRKKRDSGGGNASGGSGGKLPTISSSSSNSNNGSAEGGESGPLSLGVQGSSVTSASKEGAEKGAEVERRMLKPPPHLGADPDMKALAAMISREIFEDSPGVQFSDIIRLEEAKRLLKEAVMLPLRYPFIFTGLLRSVQLKTFLVFLLVLVQLQ